MAEDNKNASKVLLGILEKAADKLESGLADRPLFDRVRNLSNADNLPVSWLVLPLDRESLCATLKWLLVDGVNFYEDIEQSAAPVTLLEISPPQELGENSNTVPGRGIFGPCTLLVVRDCAAVSESGRVLARTMEHAPAWLVTGRPESVLNGDFATAQKMLAGSVCTPMVAVVLGDGEANWPKEIGAKFNIQVAADGDGYQKPSAKNLLNRKDIRNLKQQFLAKQLVRVLGSELTRRRESNTMRILDSRREKVDFDMALTQCDAEKKGLDDQLSGQLAAWKSAAMVRFEAGFLTDLAALSLHGKKGLDALKLEEYPVNDTMLSVKMPEASQQMTDLYHGWLTFQGEADGKWLVSSHSQLLTLVGNALQKNNVKPPIVSVEEQEFIRQFLEDMSIEKAEDSVLSKVSIAIPSQLEVVKTFLPYIGSFVALSTSLTAFNWSDKGGLAIVLKFLGVGATLAVAGISIFLFKSKRTTTINSRKVEIIKALTEFSKQVKARREKLARDKLDAIEKEVKQKAIQALDEKLSQKKTDVRRLAEEAVARGRVAEVDEAHFNEIDSLLTGAVRGMED